MCLLESLSSADSLLSGGGELAHVFTVTLDLFLLGVHTACKQLSVGGQLSGLEKGSAWGETLLFKQKEQRKKGVRR